MFLEQKIGVLGAGQLGRMLAQAAADWYLPLHGLDSDPSAPAAPVYQTFHSGHFNDYHAVMAFGADKDILTIEIEHVNTAALRDLQAMGKKVFPQPDIIETIQDKGRQKTFYAAHGIPTSPFILVDSKDDLINHINEGSIHFPFVQKSRKAGYDGKGVVIIESVAALEKAFDCPSVIEQKANIQKELAIIVSRNENGETSTFPVVEMLFNPLANLVENLLCPARIPVEIETSCRNIALQIVNELGLTGILAVEFFWQEDGSLWVNECAPRPHNSGHHTIEACYTSQYQQHLRAICGLSPGNTAMRTPCALMVNLLGEPTFHGPVDYQGLEEVISKKNTYVHLYGKSHTKPFRKMGHVTILGNDPETLLQEGNRITRELKVVSK
jgi:5-(carboxyamino)imidazole ribonucleotide synthase